VSLALPTPGLQAEAVEDEHVLCDYCMSRRGIGLSDRLDYSLVENLLPVYLR
jgi:hypothetical protein